MRGLDLFRDHFDGYTDRYVLIGGAACDLIMTEVGEQFRATRDLGVCATEGKGTGGYDQLGL